MEERRLGGRGEPGCNIVVSGPSQLSGPDGPAERRRPAGQSAGRFSGLGRRVTRFPRQARRRGTDSKGTGEPGRPVTGLGSLLGALPVPREPDGRRWRPLLGWRRSRRPVGPGRLRTTPRAPNRFHLVRALTGFPAHRTGGPGDPCDPCIICTLLHLDPGFSSRGTVDFLPVLHPVIFFQPCCFRPLATPLSNPVSWRSDPGRSRPLSSYWLSRAGPAGQLTPRRTTALRESSRFGWPRRAPARSTLGVATLLVTDARRKGGCGARDLRPTLHPLGPRRAGCWHGAVTVPGHWGDAPQLCCLGSGRGLDGSLQRDLVIELFWHSVYCSWANPQVAAGAEEACLVA